MYIQCKQDAYALLLKKEVFHYYTLWCNNGTVSFLFHNIFLTDFSVFSVFLKQCYMLQQALAYSHELSRVQLKQTFHGRVPCHHN